MIVADRKDVESHAFWENVARNARMVISGAGNHERPYSTI